MVKHPIVEPWERQPDESARAFEAFAVYRDMGPERGIRAVAQKCGKNASLIARWSSDWGWVERVRAWDNNLTESVLKKARKDIEEMQRRHVDMGRYMQGRAMNALNKILDGSMMVRDVTALAKLGIDVERLARGEATERTEGKSEVTGAIAVSPLNNLTESELRKLLLVAEGAANEDDE